MAQVHCLITAVTAVVLYHGNVILVCSV